jgi:hypothetical protein
MFDRLNNIKHIKDNNTTYINHMKHAFTLSLKAGSASVILFIHAFIPFLFEKTGSNILKNIINKDL